MFSSAVADCGDISDKMNQTAQQEKAARLRSGLRSGIAARFANRGIQSMSDLPALPDAPLGRYRHYKGGEYEVIGVARHSETLQPMVVYRPLYNDSGLWVRPYAMFFEQVEVDGVLRRRFEAVK
jgi:hypothetical protein